MDGQNTKIKANIGRMEGAVLTLFISAITGPICEGKFGIFVLDEVGSIDIAATAVAPILARASMSSWLLTSESAVSNEG